MRGALRLGRYAVRAGQSGQQQGPPAPFGIVGRLACLLVFAAVCKLWWREILCGFAGLVIMLPVAVAIGRSKLSRQREPERDELDRILARWDAEGRR